MNLIRFSIFFFSFESIHWAQGITGAYEQPLNGRITTKRMQTKPHKMDVKGNEWKTKEKIRAQRRLHSIRDWFWHHWRALVSRVPASWFRRSKWLINDNENALRSLQSNSATCCIAAHQRTYHINSISVRFRHSVCVCHLRKEQREGEWIN